MLLGILGSQLRVSTTRCMLSRRRWVTTWSPLATSFNSRPAERFNLKPKEGLFGISELRGPNGFYLLKENAVNECESLVEECLSPSRSRKLVQVFDNLSNSLCKVADMAEFVRVAHPRKAFSQAAEEACISISRLVEKLNTNRDLYESLKRVSINGDVVETTPVDDHVANLFLFDFEQSGIHLDDQKRSKVVYLNDLILYTGQKFQANAGQPTRIHKKKVPKDILHFFSTDNDYITVPGLFSDNPLELARESAYRMFLYPNQEQDELLIDLLKARNELGQVCGFPTYAHRALQGSLAENPSLVAKFLEHLSEKLIPQAEKDYYLMTKLKGSLVQAWDPPYFSSEAKNSLLNFRKSEFLPYFSLGSCMEGVNILCQSLYNIELVPVEVQSGETWTNDVYKISARNENGIVLGEIYCDFYERSGKPHQDCHFTIQGGKELENGEYQNPIVVLMLNFPPPSGTLPSLLSPSMVDNLFHEMGHALHSMIARTKYQHVTGTRCTTDFAEVPSILMEFFASDPRVLSTFARHFETGEIMPEDMMLRYSLSKHIFAASDMQMQNFYAALDQTFHTMTYPIEKSTINILEQVHNKFYGIPYINNTAWHLRFGHLVGYGAKYYSYLMSRAVASWIWQEYFQSDPFCSENGAKYRDQVLAHGGGVPAKKLVSNFLGKQITSDNLTQALIIDLEMNQKRLDKFLNSRK